MALIERPTERGVSVIECIVSLAVLAVVAGGVVVAQANLQRQARASHDRAAALRACAARLETFRVSGTAAPVAGTRSFDLPSATRERFPGSRGEETVKAAGPGLVEVEARVTWSVAGGTERTVRLTTLVAVGGER